MLSLRIVVAPGASAARTSASSWSRSMSSRIVSDETRRTATLERVIGRRLPDARSVREAFAVAFVPALDRLDLGRRDQLLDGGELLGVSRRREGLERAQHERE